ncbi:hypothetical protein CTAYLR_009596 [Chrysophaeum taylorii]|uniref:Lipoxygenase domain-containing protein n=1 Tax=Chrysophaeum taylorii TaxID=2483200 RepID=A0AAD7XPB2_9STRA|nr:hypothetical protein CTAYLR_009596 [Chrysophaeum taylorii]
MISVVGVEGFVLPSGRAEVHRPVRATKETESGIAAASSVVNLALKVATSKAASPEEAKAISITQGNILRSLQALQNLEVDDTDDDDKLKYLSYPPHPADPFYDLSQMMPMLSGAPPKSQRFSLIKILRLLWRALQGFLVVYRKQDPSNMYNDVFGRCFLKAPPITKNDLWATDRGFASQFLAGTNPILIRRVKHLRELNAVGGTPLIKDIGQVYLETLVDEENLYMVAYNEFAKDKSPREVYSEEDWPQLYFSAPIIIFSVVDDVFMPLGIQLMPRPLATYVYRPSDPEWAYAKMMVACADGNVHEWLSHLGKTHLTIEPQIIAALNRLDGHELYDFLKPHFEDTLFLNWAARKTLIYYESPEEPIDIAQARACAKESSSVADSDFSVGAANLLKIIQSYWEDYTFDAYAFDSELKSRGFDLEGDKLNDYFYANDGLLVWNAIGEYARDFVDYLYDKDVDVVEDKQLQEWAFEVADPDRANIKGFPFPMCSKPQLARALQTTIWTASALHSAVNFPQFDYMAYQPNRPSALLKPISPETARLDYIMDHALPTKAITDNIAFIVWLLTLPSKHCLTELRENERTKWRHVYAKFKTNLLHISSLIQARNDKLNTTDVPFPYDFLDPTQIPASIDI